MWYRASCFHIWFRGGAIVCMSVGSCWGLYCSVDHWVHLTLAYFTHMLGRYSVFRIYSRFSGELFRGGGPRPAGYFCPVMPEIFWLRTHVDGCGNDSDGNRDINKELSLQILSFWEEGFVFPLVLCSRICDQTWVLFIAHHYPGEACIHTKNDGYPEFQAGCGSLKSVLDGTPTWCCSGISNWYWCHSQFTVTYLYALLLDPLLGSKTPTYEAALPSHVRQLRGSKLWVTGRSLRCVDKMRTLTPMSNGGIMQSCLSRCAYLGRPTSLARSSSATTTPF